MAEAKGIGLEREFAKYMESKLGYTNTKLRQPIKGKIAERNYEVDIYAEQYSEKWNYVFKLGILIIILSILALTVPELKSVNEFMENMVKNFSPGLAGYGAVVVGVAAAVIGYIARKKEIKYAWVECKDLSSNVKRAHIQKLIASVEDVRKYEDVKWKPDEVIVVSGKDFDADALNFADEHEFLCYKRTAHGFTLVN